MPSSDRAFRALANAEPDTIVALLRVVVPAIVPASGIVTTTDVVPTRLDALPAALDADWIVRFLGAPQFLHVECQGYRDPGFPDRVFWYHLHIALLHRWHYLRTLALWLVRPPGAQLVSVISHGEITVRVTHAILADVPASALLSAPVTACFASGADAGTWSHDDLCERVASALREGKASWYQRHMAVVAAAMAGRYDAMVTAMERAGLEPVVIEDLVRFGEDRGLEKGLARGRAEGKAEGKAEGRAEGKAEGKAEGRAEGRAESVLAILEARGLAVDAALRARILRCSKLKVLDRWIRRAAVVSSVEEIFVRG